MASSLYVPCGDERKLAKAVTLPVDDVTIDLEDAIAPSQKAQARAALARTIAAFASTRIQTRVRINAVSTDLWADDIRAAIAAGVKRLVVPKLESRSQIEAVDEFLDAEGGREMTYSVILETAASVLWMDELIVANGKMRSASIGFADLCADMGIRWHDAFTKLPALFAAERTRLAMTLRARGLNPSWDTAWLAIDDLEGLRRDAEFGRRLGCVGKVAIHPKHLDIINEVYAPDEAEVARARRIVEAFEASVDSGVGALKVDGMMIDIPVVNEARAFLERYEDRRTGAGSPK